MGGSPPFLWFDGEAEEAANFYVSVFRNSNVVSTHEAPPASPLAGLGPATVGDEGLEPPTSRM